MTRSVDYYFSLASPWVYLGHDAFMEVARLHGVRVNHKPVLLGRIFDETGGLPLPKRHPARQRYRLMELKRWGERRGRRFNLRPRHSPFDVQRADRFVIAILAGGGDPDAFMRRAMAGVWEEERDLADPATIAGIAGDAGYEAEALMAAAEGDMTEAVYALNLENAVEAGVFGAPAFVLDGEVFWGQDRIDFLADALASGRPAHRPEPA